jgi:hypothetical protein
MLFRRGSIPILPYIMQKIIGHVRKNQKGERGEGLKPERTKDYKLTRYKREK